MNFSEEKNKGLIEEVIEISSQTSQTSQYSSEDGVLKYSDHGKRVVHRRLKSRHIHLIAFGGAIGTGLFVTIGNALVAGGPGSLFLAFALYAIVVCVLCFSIGEIICYLPIESPFISFAGRVVDPAFEVAVGYNFFFMVSIYVPFEITAVNSMIHFWRDDYNGACEFIPHLLSYIALNVFAVKYFGESEFYLSLGKIILATGLLFFTFISMVGGNPQHDAFGFRYWKDPGSFATYLTGGDFGRFNGFWVCVSKAVFSMAGPEYLSMAAGETENPRVVLPAAFKTVPYRLCTFFVGGALSVGILVAYNDPTLLSMIATGAAGANVSPYVVAMNNMAINVLPHIVNVLCITSAYSAGNSYFYSSSRSLYTLAKKGMAPKIFGWCTKNGVPLPALAVTTCFGLLSLLELGNGAVTVLNWLVNLSTGCQATSYFFLFVIYIFFYHATQAQGLNRLDPKVFPLQTFITKWQPYPAYIGCIIMFLITFFLGYQAFIPSFSIDDFLYYYLIIFVDIFILIAWKIFFKTKIIKSSEADLTTGMKEVEEHERIFHAMYDGKREKMTKFQKVLDWLL